MKKEDKDITNWRDGLKEYENKRKNLNWTEFPLVKHFTTKDAKLKELEYHPILQKYADYDRDQATTVKDSELIHKKQEQKLQQVAKYELDYDPINLHQKPSASPKRDTNYNKPRVVPVNQVDYNIINNEKLGDEFFTNIKYNGIRKKEYVKHAPNLEKRDFNILTNKYFKDDDSRKTFEKQSETEKIQQKFNATRIYNPLVAQFYDKNKEQQFAENRQTEQQTHYQRFLDKLPPSIRYRESVSLDPTKEVPEETKKVDLKRELAKQRYKLKYQMEKEYRDRSDIQNMVNEERAKNRIYDAKFYEHLKKGYDIISTNKVSMADAKTNPKPELTTWEKVQHNSTGTGFNTGFDANARSSSFTKSNLFQHRPAQELHTMNTDPNFLRSENTPIAHVRKGNVTSVKPRISSSSVQTSVEFTNNSNVANNTENNNRLSVPIQRGSVPEIVPNRRTVDEIYKSLNLKDPYARAREPAYNLADKYSAFEVKPRLSMESDHHVSSVPVKENQLRFSMMQTGGFRRSAELG